MSFFSEPLQDLFRNEKTCMVKIQFEDVKKEFTILFQQIYFSQENSLQSNLTIVVIQNPIQSIFIHYNMRETETGSYPGSI